MKISLAQFPVSHSLEVNKQAILRHIRNTESGALVVFPEGALTGFFPAEDDYLAGISPELVMTSLGELAEVTKEKRVHCLVGTAYPQKTKWYNSAILLRADGSREMYHKCKITPVDSNCFIAADKLPVFSVDGVKIGVQICWELLFVEQWQALKTQGADVIIHLNNAINPKDSFWEHVLLTRAFECRSYVCSVNNTAAPQALASMVVTPGGEIIEKLPLQQDLLQSVELDLSQVRPRWQSAG